MCGQIVESFRDRPSHVILMKFLLTTISGLFTSMVTLILLAPVSAAAARAPNILFIFSDDHAYQAISAYGDPRKLLDTPNIDRIGREGMRFDRCLVPNSI